MLLWYVLRLLKNKRNMSVIISSCSFLSCSKPPQVHGYLNFNKHTQFLRQEFTTERCWTSRSCPISRAQNNYYELLGISTESNAQEIREAYRKLQKKHHPDIVGQKGHEYTLLLNEAYEVLMRNDLRRKYDESIKQMGMAFGENNPPLGSSMWKGPIRSQALFVDENACIGCRECVHHASNTFIMDEARGCARVKVQDGDMDKNIEVSIESCPVNCIYWVNTEELAVLEFLIQPQPKEGYGVFGGGWERPKNIFTAAESFKKQLKRQATTSKHRNTS